MAQPKKTARKTVHPKATFNFRKQVVPSLLGLMMCLIVFALLNLQFIIAQAQYRFSKPVDQSSLVVDSSAADKDALQLYIPKINVSAPVVYDEPSYLEHRVQLALRRGVVHYGSTAVPGQAGNIVMLGHSSGQPWAAGDYKFVFTMLDKLAVGGTIITDYKGTRYIFKVAEMKVIDPSNLSVLESSNKPKLTLITCTPVGTDINRLVVTANQVSPKPETAAPMVPEDIKPVTAWTIPR